MKRMLCFFILIPLIIFSQEIPKTEYVSISKGKPYKYYERLYGIGRQFNYYKIFNINNDYIFIKQKHPNYDIIIRFYDLYSKEELWCQIYKKNTIKTNNFLKIGNNIYNSYWLNNRKEGGMVFYMQKVNLKDGSLSDPQMLFVIKDGRHPYIHKYDFNDTYWSEGIWFEETRDFLFKQSFDNNKFLIQYYRMKPGENRRVVSALCVFDGNKNTSWYREYELPYYLKDIKNGNYQVDIYGNVYFFCTIDGKGSIIKFDEHAMALIVENINMDNIVSPFLKDGPEGLMFFTGLSHIGGHSFEAKGAFLNKNPEHIEKIADAVFMTTFDANGNIKDIKHFKFSNSPLYFPFLKQKDIPYLFLNGIEVIDNGDLVFVGSVFTKNFEFKSQAYIVYLIGEIALNISKEGKLNWINTSEEGYLSLDYMIKTKDYFILPAKNSCKIIDINTGEIRIEKIDGFDLKGLVSTPNGFAMEVRENRNNLLLHFDFN